MMNFDTEKYGHRLLTMLQVGDDGWLGVERAIAQIIVRHERHWLVCRQEMVVVYLHQDGALHEMGAHNLDKTSLTNISQRSITGDDNMFIVLEFCTISWFADMNVSHHGCKALRNMLSMMFISSCVDNSPTSSLPTAPPYKHLEPHIDNRFWRLLLRLLSRCKGFSHRAPKHQVWPQTRIGPLSRFCSYENPRCQWAPTHGGSKYYSPPTRTGPGQLRIPRFSHRGALKLKLYKVSHSDPSLIFSQKYLSVHFHDSPEK